MTEHQTHPMSAGKPQDIMYYVNELEKMCDEYLVKKAPFSLPENIKEIIVKLAYPLAIVGAVFMVLAILGMVAALVAYLGLSAISMPFAGKEAVSGFNLVGLIIVALQLGVTALSIKLFFQAIPGLKTRSHTAWKYTYYGYLLGVVQNLLSTHSIMGVVFGLVPALVSTVIGLYIWFQVKDKYTK